MRLKTLPRRTRHFVGGNMLKNQCKKTSQFITQCKGDINYAFETVKFIVFDPMMCKSPDVPLQDECCVDYF